MTPDRLSIPGLHHSLRLYHFADTHLQAGADTDPRLPPAWKNDPTPKLPLDNRTLLQSHLDRARNGGSDLILACGDLCHFPSPENARLVSTLLDASPVPVWTLPGNHDWFYPGQDGWEAMRDRQLPRLRNVLRDPDPGIGTGTNTASALSPSTTVPIFYPRSNSRSSGRIWTPTFPSSC